MLKGNIPYFFRPGTKRDGVLGTTRCGSQGSQGYSVYLLYDVLLSFEPSMDEGVCTWKKSYWMDHYSKTKSVSDEPEGKKEPCDIQVKSGSKIRNIISQAMRILQVGLLMNRRSPQWPHKLWTLGNLFKYLTKPIKYPCVWGREMLTNLFSLGITKGPICMFTQPWNPGPGTTHLKPGEKLDLTIKALTWPFNIFALFTRNLGKLSI